MRTKVTILFEDPFWVGIFEKWTGKGYSVARVVFGAEPADLTVYLFILTQNQAIPYSPPKKKDIETFRNIESVSPKRRERLAARELKDQKGLKKAYQAIKIEHELLKEKRKTISKEKRETEEKRKFELKQEKRREKKKGH